MAQRASVAKNLRYAAEASARRRVRILVEPKVSKQIEWPVISTFQIAESLRFIFASGSTCCGFASEELVWGRGSQDFVHLRCSPQAESWLGREILPNKWTS